MYFSAISLHVGFSLRQAKASIISRLPCYFLSNQLKECIGPDLGHIRLLSQSCCSGEWNTPTFGAKGRDSFPKRNWCPITKTEQR